jgi:hypothetical protein
VILPPATGLAPLRPFLPLYISRRAAVFACGGRWSYSGQAAELQEAGAELLRRAVFFCAGFFVATFGLCFCIIRRNFLLH